MSLKILISPVKVDTAANLTAAGQWTHLMSLNVLCPLKNTSGAPDQAISRVKIDPTFEVKQNV